MIPKDPLGSPKDTKSKTWVPKGSQRDPTGPQKLHKDSKITPITGDPEMATQAIQKQAKVTKGTPEGPLERKHI